MLAQADIERAATAAVQRRAGWKVMLVHQSGALAWTINYATPPRFVTVHIPVDAESTEADIRRRIEEKLP